MSNTSSPREVAFTLGYRSALAGEHVIRAPFATDEESEGYNEGFQEGCHRVDDLHSDAFE